jgi:hypothetical protein
MPDPAPGPARRRRPTILLLMAVVAASAVPIGVVKYRMDAAARRVRAEALRAELANAEARAEWSERMNRRGYVPAAKAAAARIALDRARAELEAFEGR